MYHPVPAVISGVHFFNCMKGLEKEEFATVLTLKFLSSLFTVLFDFVGLRVWQISNSGSNEVGVYCWLSWLAVPSFSPKDPGCTTWRRTILLHPMTSLINEWSLQNRSYLQICSQLTLKLPDSSHFTSLFSSSNFLETLPTSNYIRGNQWLKVKLTQDIKLLFIRIII